MLQITLMKESFTLIQGQSWSIQHYGHIEHLQQKQLKVIRSTELAIENVHISCQLVAICSLQRVFFHQYHMKEVMHQSVQQLEYLYNNNNNK